MVPRVSAFVAPTLFCWTLSSLVLAGLMHPDVASAQAQRQNWAALLGARAPVATAANAGSFNWTPEAQAAAQYMHSTLCPTFSLDDLSVSQYPSDVKRQVIEAVETKTGYTAILPGLGSEDAAAVDAAIERACAPPRISKQLLDWHYQLGGQRARPYHYPPPPWRDGAPGIFGRMPRP